jgi:hypothetical protein
MTQKELETAILDASADGRLSCEKAHVLSRDLNVSLREIGALCDKIKIKISSCELGCF